MKVENQRVTRSIVAWVLAAFFSASLGCTPKAEFRLNFVYAQVQKKQNGVELTSAQFANLKDILAAGFGYPDEPKTPSLEGVDLTPLMDINKLRMAAGPVGRDGSGRPRGLYREHCAHCHGITGGGAGPTSEFLNPYPRDYRRGLYKFKSTPRTLPPTDEDLHRTLMEGIPGTSMPTFRLLPGNELEALIHYVRYLSIRGETERLLIAMMVTDLEEGELLFDPVGDDAKQKEQSEAIRSVIEEVAQKWLSASDNVTEVPPPPKMAVEDSINHGRTLFYGKVANCIKCHGPGAIGDGVTNDYDEWNKELDPKSPGTLPAMLAAGAHPPRPIQPRNLRLNVFRGGRRPVDIYWRIKNGIAGTPMPAASMQPPDAPPDDVRLQSDDIWHLIHYVRSLPYDPASQPAHLQPTNLRERH